MSLLPINKVKYGKNNIPRKISKKLLFYSLYISTTLLLFIVIHIARSAATRTIMAGINPVTTALMPLSQVVAWYLVIRYEQIGITFYNAVCPIATFYCIWALYINVIQRSVDLGLYTMGAVAIATFYEKKYWTIGGSILVWLNFTLPAIFILILWDAKKTAKTIKNDTSPTGITWAYIFKGYFISNIILWSFILYRVIKTDDAEPQSTVSNNNLKYEEIKNEV